MPQLKWITSQFPSPSHLSMLAMPREVGPPLAGMRETSALSLQQLLDRTGVAHGDGIADDENSRQSSLSRRRQADSDERGGQECGESDAVH